jgi:DNA processing protein
LAGGNRRAAFYEVYCLGEPETDEQLLDLIHLTAVPGVGPQTGRALLERFGSAGRVLSASQAQLSAVDGVGPKLAQKIGRARLDFDALSELALCRRLGVSIVARDDSRYPAALHNIPDPPVLLYVRGALEPKDELAIALVGSRRCTPYGARMAERLAAGLARTGFTVVSGLARGVDAAAHRGALGAGGRSIAVLANGLSSIYPPEHEELARALALAGALVSEMPMRQVPLPGLFTQRNRIISGIVLGVVVVEATQRSGSLSTARHAMEQNREVFAVPGPADSLTSRGCHRLIRDGARLVESVDDILEELGPLSREIRADPGEPPVRHPAELALSDLERSLLGHLDDQPSGVDELIVRTGMTAAQVLATLSVLEVKRLAKRLAGHQFVRA